MGATGSPALFGWELLSSVEVVDDCGPPFFSCLHMIMCTAAALLSVVYQPQAVFRVRPVTRCTASIPGHAEAVLAASFGPDGRGLVRAF